jgi:hypothetical protein
MIRNNEHPDGSCGVFRGKENEAYFFSFQGKWFASVFSQKNDVGWVRVFFAEYESKENVLKALEPWKR